MVTEQCVMNEFLAHVHVIGQNSTQVWSKVPIVKVAPPISNPIIKMKLINTLLPGLYRIIYLFVWQTYGPLH